MRALGHRFQICLCLGKSVKIVLYVLFGFVFFIVKLREKNNKSHQAVGWCGCEVEWVQIKQPYPWPWQLVS